MEGNWNPKATTLSFVFAKEISPRPSKHMFHLTSRLFLKTVNNTVLQYTTESFGDLNLELAEVRNETLLQIKVGSGLVQLQHRCCNCPHYQGTDTWPWATATNAQEQTALFLRNPCQWDSKFMCSNMEMPFRLIIVSLNRGSMVVQRLELLAVPQFVGCVLRSRH